MTEETKQAGVSDEPPPDPDPQGSGGDGSDGTGDGKKGPTVAELANRQLQGIVDQDLVHLDNRDFKSLNPKTVQLLSRFAEITRGSTEGSETEGGTPEPARIFEPKGEAGSKTSHYEQVGREAEAKQTLGQIKGELETDVVATMWASDVRAFLTDIGDLEITEELFAEMDFTDRRKFPANQAGYTAWQAAARKVYRQLLKGESEESAEAKGVDADREAAGGSKRPPNPKGSKAGIKDAHDLAIRFRRGEINKEQFREGMAKFRMIS